MRTAAMAAVAMCAACAAAMLGGCAGSGGRVDLTQAVTVVPATQPGVGVDVVLTSAHIENGITEIGGLVRRRAGFEGTVPGHVDVVVVDGAGRQVMRLPLEWRPKEIPVAGRREAAFLMRMAWTPPAGTALRVEYDAGSTCVAVRGLRRYDNLAGLEPGVGLVPYDRPGAAVFQRQNDRMLPIDGPQVGPMEPRGARSPNYTGTVYRVVP